MASSGHSNLVTTKVRKGATALPGADPEKVFAQGVEKLQQRLDLCSRMRTYSEMKPVLEEISELVKLFFADTNELATLYMDGSVFHSFVLSAVQLLIKKAHKRDNQMFMKALDLLFSAIDKYERSSFFHLDRASSTKVLSRLRQESENPEHTLAFRDITDELREIDDAIMPFARDLDSDDEDDEDGEDNGDEEMRDEHDHMDIDGRYNNGPEVKKDFFETFLVAILPEVRDHLMSTFQVRELLARTASGGGDAFNEVNRDEVNTFLNTSLNDSDDDFENQEAYDGIGLIPGRFKMPLRDDLTIRYMSHTFKLIYFYFRNVNADTLLQTKFTKIALLIVTNQRFFHRAFAFKIVRTFLTNGRKDGVDFDLPNSLIGYLLKNFLIDELDEFTGRLKVNENIKQFISCLNKSFIRELVGILNFVEFLDRPLWAFRIVLNVKQSLDRLYESLKQAINLLIAAKDSMRSSKGARQNFNAVCSSEYIDLLLVQCIKGAAMIVNKLKDFYPAYEEAFVIANILFGLLTPARANFFSRNELEFKKAFYQFIFILISDRGIALNVFIYEYWPRLKPIWAQDMASANQSENGSLLLISRFCKYAVCSDQTERLIEIAQCFAQALELNASKKPGLSVSKLVATDTLSAISDLMAAYEKLTDTQIHHAAHCHLAKKNPGLVEKLAQVCKRLLTTVLAILDRMSNPVFFKTCVSFYKKVFENAQLLALFDLGTWLPHIELLLNKVDQIYADCTIQELRDMFFHAGGSQLLIILSGIFDNFVANNKCTTPLDQTKINNFLAVIKISNEQLQNKKVLKRTAKLETRLNLRHQ